MIVRPKYFLLQAMISVSLLGTLSTAVPMPLASEYTRDGGGQASAQLLTQDEMEFLFGVMNASYHKDVRLAFLDQGEMANTEGRSGPIGAVLGAAAGAAGYAGGVMVGGSGTAAGLAGAAVGGAVGGFIAGPVTGAFVGGVVGKGVENFCSSCHGVRHPGDYVKLPLSGSASL